MIIFCYIVTLSKYLSWLLVILWAPTNFNHQIDKFYNELFKVMWNREDLYTNKKMVLYLTIPRKAKFTVCGLFTLEYPLFTSIIAASVTYLMILIQINE
ncbi:hypothetical protein GE061_006297 [Apolygus lucorum]|uniref:Uncharacterized protein n=1 Tax=Apolygus lucorum TaxID=248454 RepID=A0A6A4J1J4_APOLU|nr:hypothetical protein GE061_006297 [Apolygus lucorum]